MKNRKQHSRNVFFALSLIALLTLAASATARPAEPGRRGAPEGFGPGPRLERLDLNEEQAAEIRKIREAGRKENLELRKQLMRLRNEMEGEMLADEPSRKKVMELNEKMGELRTRLRANRLSERLAIRERLTPEQRDRMLLMKDHGKRGRGGRHGLGPHEGRGGPQGPGPRNCKPCPRPDGSGAGD